MHTLSSSLIAVHALADADLVYNAFYACSTLPEAGFDYAAIARLHPIFQSFCGFMALCDLFAPVCTG